MGTRWKVPEAMPFVPNRRSQGCVPGLPEVKTLVISDLKRLMGNCETSEWHLRNMLPAILRILNPILDALPQNLMSGTIKIRQILPTNNHMLD